MNTRTLTMDLIRFHLKRGSVFADRYDVIDLLGQGGMGKVYRVFDRKIKEEIALKLIKNEIASDKKAIERFSLELKIARKISNKNVCRMYDINDHAGIHYITMEYIPGEDLNSLIKRVKKITVEKAIHIAIQVCNGLAEAHKLGIVHRDLKPQNIMIDKKGNAYIMDFGIARSLETQGITEVGKIVGTPKYMSPEQIDCLELDGRSDIYSLGIVLYEMVTGNAPFDSDNFVNVVLKHKSKAPKNPKKIDSTIPNRLCDVILKCLEKDRGKRYQKIEDLISNLNGIKKALFFKKKDPINKVSMVDKFVGLIHKKKVKIAVAMLLILAAGAVVVWIQKKISKIDYAKNADFSETIKQPSINKNIEPRVFDGFKIKEVSDGSETVKIDGGVEDKLYIGKTGSIYYEKQENDGESITIYIAEFFITDVRKEESLIEIFKQKEKIVKGYLIKFDQKNKAVLSIACKQKEAEIFINNEKRGKTDFKMLLNPGTYKVAVKKNKFMEYSRTVNLLPGDRVPLDLSLTPIMQKLGQLVITSNPPGADVFFRNKDSSIGITPFRDNLEPGKYIIEVALRNYYKESETFKIKAGERISRNFDLNPKDATIKIESIPKKAEVFINNEMTPSGKTPFQMNLPPNNYRIRLHLEGFKDQIDEIILNPGKMVLKNYTMRKIMPKKSILVVNTIPDGASVYINNVKQKYKTPMEISLEASKVELRIEKENYKAYEESVSLKYHVNTENLTLEKLRKAQLIISSYREALIELDGKLLEKSVPPEKKEEVYEGIHKVKFIFDENLFIEKTINIENGEINRIHCDDEEYRELKKERCRYEIKAWPLAKVKIDGESLNEPVPPLKTIWINEGTHKIKYLFENQLAVTINDTINKSEKKNIHLGYEIQNIQISEDLNQLKKTIKWQDESISIESNNNLDIKVAGGVRYTVPSNDLLIIPYKRKNGHHFELFINPNKSYETVINLIRIGEKKIGKIELRILLDKSN